MTVSVENREAAFPIPVVDISQYLEDPRSSEADRVVEIIRHACETSGIFEVTGHGIPIELQDRVFEATKAVFNLPADEKLKLSGKPGRGYEVYGNEVREADTRPDVREGYFVGRQLPGMNNQFRPFGEPNIWPDPKILPETKFRQPMLEYLDAVTDLSFHLMQILARGLPQLDTRVIAEFCRDPIAAIRPLRYPSQPKDSAVVGTGAHTDFGAITLLLQDGNSGLQAFDPSQNAWVEVPSRRDGLVVNVGDMLQTWTNGAYKSNTHRVINTSGSDRYSVPFFLDGNSDCVLRPLDGSSDGDACTVEEHMLKMYAVTYK
ncbi:hypothetical protein HRR83_005508 [Exophiala dermatitidis]|uniref:Fe2OG dioxygenase domain-containing protein n=2 Tax=Exophiala dermatitidis TaxID=5970 RepID=H6C459_EXODN|nr:uncharacterized protein HMPREF1120_05613 [Exophiala dermatitidis NIH/UT8656]KAJ4516204.1 hypothetical protein HRR74_005361 [Exophiala dermatitidis]EHY57584.1 hypothetical protein HMPREF1120_05613 [Exophiala dermatitidis NIH/UT8656]KAJ4518390.1 hypothetical protein HRR73_003971 [Exophiala dermatitidis]KAJ4533882.1 hypothetical protein HRR76_005835 [Exophiala dermatitidis]KAJ4553386.1 hypothetical protein HRR79_009581 [Exophiala dermatitidis]